MKLELAKEFAVVALREMPLPADMLQCDTPAKAVDYWNQVIKANLHFKIVVSYYYQWL